MEGSVTCVGGGGVSVRCVKCLPTFAVNLPLIVAHSGGVKLLVTLLAVEASLVPYLSWCAVHNVSTANTHTITHSHYQLPLSSQQHTLLCYSEGMHQVQCREPHLRQASHSCALSVCVCAFLYDHMWLTMHF